MKRPIHYDVQKIFITGESGCPMDVRHNGAASLALASLSFSIHFSGQSSAFIANGDDIFASIYSGRGSGAE